MLRVIGTIERDLRVLVAVRGNVSEAGILVVLTMHASRHEDRAVLPLSSNVMSVATTAKLTGSSGGRATLLSRVFIRTDGGIRGCGDGIIGELRTVKHDGRGAGRGIRRTFELSDPVFAAIGIVSGAIQGIRGEIGRDGDGSRGGDGAA